MPSFLEENQEVIKLDKKKTVARCLMKEFLLFMSDIHEDKFIFSQKF